MFRRLLFILALLSAPLSQARARDVPYWAALRSGEVNMRVGPSESYPIDWVYRRAGLPVKVVRLYQGWRRVRDPDGTEGWVVAPLLSPERSAIVIGKGLAAMRADADPASAMRWNLEPGVVGKLGKCDRGWCELDVNRRKGWVEQARLWGAGEP